MPRPTDYTEELATLICEKIATSNKGLHTLCEKNKNFPAFSTIFLWLSQPDKKSFLEKYMRAREAQADFLAEEILTIADDSSKDTKVVMKGNVAVETENKEWISRAKLRISSRIWMAAKLYPKKYSDKLNIDADVKQAITTVTPNIIGTTEPFPSNESEID